MYVDKSTRTKNGNSYTRTLLRRSIWKDGKCTKETVANISDCTEEEIAVIKTALKKRKLCWLWPMSMSWSICARG
jgi:hypothetical protein